MLGWIERVGNKLPHPVVLFIILAAFVIVLSQILASLGVEVTYFDTADQEYIYCGGCFIIKRFRY